ncbi:hypothetical protein ACFQL1_01560 [Halomicroarcula sp. GCM10025709]|uniref:hypothetical protein n=1 Tax=Haloarcula TaxID=2237 RepID=UPI0024C235A6|nr:hypothetical protein [Halomicroarcula sp. YJ-61-S]
MTAPETTWVLDQLASAQSNIAAGYSDSNGNPVELIRVDRDESQLYDGSGSFDMSGSVRSRSGDLKDGVFVGVTHADTTSEPIGTEYDHRRETIVGVRIEGMHTSEWGKIDPAGESGIPWADAVRAVRRAITNRRTFPDAGARHVSYTDLTLANEVDDAASHSDYYLATFDVVFNGYETLPIPDAPGIGFGTTSAGQSRFGDIS